jgi:O-antigen/teichoic acid export membrane protein
VNPLAGGALLRRNVLLNLLGWGLPAALALVAIPILVRGYGESRFGVLAIAWAVIGYFGLFDLGLSRALTQRLSDALGRGAAGEVAPVSWTALAMMAPLGVAGALALALLAPWIAERVLVIPADLREESVGAFRWFAVAVPFTVFTAGVRGVLEAGQRFGAINLLRVPLGLLTFGGPLIALAYSPSLVAAAQLLAAGRIVLAVLHGAAAAHAFPALLRPAFLRAEDWIPLVRYGGWMTVSNVVSPLMNSMDRFGLGVLLPVAQVAFYATSFEVVTKVWLITAAVLPVLFPAMSATLVADRARTVRLFDRGTTFLLATAIPILLLMVLFARPGIAWWVNPGFAAAAAPALRWLAVAMSLNIVAQLALTLVQAAGRPDLSAKFHLAELPVYALLLLVLVERYGALGAALAWGARVALDAALLLWAAARVVPESAAAVRRAGLMGLAATAALALIAATR